MGLGVATIVASPSLFSHGFLVAIPAILGLRMTVFWVVMVDHPVAPGSRSSWRSGSSSRLYRPRSAASRPVDAPPGAA